MNEVDLEIQRLATRVVFTSFVIVICAMIGIYFLIQQINQYSEFDVTWLIMGGLIGFSLHGRIEPYIQKFYEKRLINSKRRSHTT